MHLLHGYTQISHNIINVLQSCSSSCPSGYGHGTCLVVPAIGTDPLVLVYQACEGIRCGCLIEYETWVQCLGLFDVMRCSQGEAAAVRASLLW